MLTIEYALNAIYTAEDFSSISLDVKFVEIEEVIPFTATHYDIEPYGVELFNRATAGDFGDISPYVAPPLVIEPVQPLSQGAQTL